jgi:tRNA(Arg) A34 adenosine deaminase TadA
MHVNDEAFIRRAYGLARDAVAHGNHPFGALLVFDEEVLMESENEVVTSRDVTRHAETRLVATASARFETAQLAPSTLYTSTEPCIMCCGAIHWAGIRRIVFGVRGKAMVASFAGDYRGIACRDVFATLNPSVEIVGPLLEAEGLELHRNFWPEFLARNRSS